MAIDSWLTVKPMSGKGNATLSNTGTLHTGRIQRSTVVTAVVVDMDEGKSYTVNQKPSEEFLTLDQTTFSIGELGGTITITGKSNSPKLTFALGANSGIPMTIPTKYTVNSLENANGANITGDPGAKAQFTFSAVITVPRNYGAERTGTVVVTGSNTTVSGIATVTQAIATFTITYSKGDYINTIAKTSETVQYGKAATNTATLPANTAQYSYTFDGWYEGSTKVGSALALNVPNISANHTYQAKGIRTVNKYTLTINVSPAAGGSASGAGTYDWGTKVQATATPAEGYTFQNWKYDASGNTSTANPATFTIESNLSVTANFQLKYYDIVTTNQYRVAESGAWTTGTTGGTTTGGGNMGYGSTATTVAVPANGYEFEGWYEGETRVSSALSYSFTVTKGRTLIARFQRKWFTITFTAGTGGSVAPTSARVEFGGSASSTATASAGYTFSGWSDGTKTATLTVTNVQASATYAASFGLNTYVVTYTKGTGIASVNPTSQTVSHGNSASGSTATLTTGYNFDGWYDGTTKISSTLASGAIGPITANRTIEARATIKTFAITGTPYYRNTDNTGSYTQGTTGGTVTGSGTYNYGAKATLTAAAATGYTFKGWADADGEIVSTSPTYTINSVTAAFKIDALFQKNWYTVTYTKNANISTLSKTSERVSYGSTATCTATLPSNSAGATYTFDGWYESTTKVGSALALSVANITSNRTFEARGNSSVPSYTITVTSDDTDKGTVAGGGSYKYNASVTVTATRKTGYTFEGWYEGSTRVSTSASYTFICTGARTLVAKWSVYTISITPTVTPTGGGTVSPNPITGQEGKSVNATATPATGYQFSKWSDGSTSNPIGVVLTAGKTVQAVFTLKSYTVTYAKGTGVSAVSRTSETVTHGGNAAGSTATVSTGYTFDGWYNGSTRVSTSLTYAPTNVTANMTLTAQATINKYTLTLSAYYRNLESGNYTAGTTGGTVTGGGTVNHGGSKIINATAAEGYTFVGWYTAGASGGTLLSSNAAYTVTNITANQTIYARFQKRYFTVEYHVGTYVSSVSRSSERVAYGANAAGSTMTVNSTTAQYSYAVDGWYNSSGSRVTTSATYAPTNVIANATYTAKATRSTRSYVITYVAGDYISAVSRTSESVSYGGAATGSTATVMATTAQYTYAFDGWYQGTTKVSSSLTWAPTNVQGTATYMAKATRTLRSYTVSVALHSSNPGRGTVTGGGTYNYGASVTVKCTLSKTGDVFDGWYNGSTKVSSSLSYTFTVSGAVSLTAKILFIDVSPTSLSYTADGGSKTLTITSNVGSWTVS